MAKTALSFAHRNIEDCDKKIQDIYYDLLKGGDKKKIANQYSVNLDLVMAIAQRFRTGQQMQPTPEEIADKAPRIVAISGDLMKHLGVEEGSSLQELEPYLGEVPQFMLDAAARYHQPDAVVEEQPESKEEESDAPVEEAEESTEQDMQANTQLAQAAEKYGLKEYMVTDIINRSYDETAASIAEHYNIPVQTVYKIKEEFGVVKKKQAANKSQKKLKKQKRDEERKRQEAARLARREADLKAQEEEAKRKAEQEALEAQRLKEAQEEAERKRIELQRKLAEEEVARQEAERLKQEQIEANRRRPYDEKLQLIYTNKNVISVGLVSDRHDMPATEFIFEGPIPENLMFNYDDQEDVMRRFIKSHIKFNEEGVADKCLCIYVTGMSCCIATAIKVCHEMGVNLTLMHYNNTTRTYRAQIVWDSFKCDSAIPLLFRNNYARYNSIYTFNCTMQDIINSNIFYAAVEAVYETYSEVPSQDIILALDKIDIIEPYNRMCMSLMERHETSVIYVSENEMVNGNMFRRIRTLMKTSNNK